MCTAPGISLGNWEPQTQGETALPGEPHGLLLRKTGAERERAPRQGPGMQQGKESPQSSTTPPAPLPSRSKSLKPVETAASPLSPWAARRTAEAKSICFCTSRTKTYCPLDSEAWSNKAELCFHRRKGDRHHGAAEPG